MKNDSTSFFANNHFANSYVYDISISHVPAYFGLHWHHYIEIVLAQDNGIIYEVNGETFPLKPGDLLFIWPGELHAVSTTNREHRLIMLPGNRKASRISDRASQALPLRYQFF